MKRLRWQILVVLLTLVLVGILLLSQKPDATIIGAQPAAGGVYTEALVGAMGRLNPLLDWNNAPDRDVDRLIYSSLMHFDSRGMPEPDLAESWGMTEDGTIYNFSIRGNAVWHDGQPVTTDDVIFTIELMKSPASFYPQDVKELWSKVEVVRLNDKTMQIKLPEPYAPFLDYTAFGVLPKHLLSSIPMDQVLNAEFNLKPVGSGPFKFDHLLVEGGQITGVVLTAFDQYYRQRPYIDQVIFKYYPTAAAGLEAYRAGEVAGVSQITADILSSALAENELSIYTSRMPQMGMVVFNLNNPEVPFLQEPEIRKALMLGLNRQRLIDAFLQGQAIPADGPILPGSWAHYDGVEHIPYDDAAAIVLLKELGYTLPADGSNVRANENQSLAFTLVHPNDPTHTQMAQSIQQNWAAIGVKVDLIPASYESLQNEYLGPRRFQAALVELAFARTPDPDPYPFWHQAEAVGGQNYSQWDNRTASEYLEQARVTTDFGLRARLYRNFQVIFSRELPALPLYVPVYSYAVAANVQGVQTPPLFDPSDRFSLIEQWYLVTRRGLEQTPTPAP
jgi:peptide/nickel transport system substrate-binding protein